MDHQYQDEVKQLLVKEYSERTGTDILLVYDMFAKGMLVEKTGSDSKSYLVENPDYLDDNGNLKKIRRKPTNITPKKKKRKK